MATKTWTLYKIYHDDVLVYLGRTSQDLQRRLYGHFFKAPHLREIQISQVSKVEYALFPSEADLFLYEIYYINKDKPPLNHDDKAHDELTVLLPEASFMLFDCKLMVRWKEKVKENDDAEEARKKSIHEWELTRQHNRKTMSSDDYHTWLDYEPRPN